MVQTGFERNDEGMIPVSDYQRAKQVLSLPKKKATLPERNDKEIIRRHGDLSLLKVGEGFAYFSGDTGHGNWKPLNNNCPSESVLAVVIILILKPFNCVKRGFWSISRKE